MLDGSYSALSPWDTWRYYTEYQYTIQLNITILARLFGTHHIFHIGFVQTLNSQYHVHCNAHKSVSSKYNIFKSEVLAEVSEIMHLNKVITTNLPNMGTK